MSEPPEKSGADIAHALVKAAVAAVPVAGGPAAEIFALIVAPPLDRRRNRWLQELAAAVDQIRAQVGDITPEKLSKNETFITTLLHATQIASHTHQEEKIRALRNAIVNAAMPDAPDDTMQAIFLHYVDELTPWHLRILSYFQNPAAAFKNPTLPHGIAGSPSASLEAAIPELRGRRAFYDQLVLELASRGLMDGNIHGMTTPQGAVAPRTKEIGSQLIQFISDPGARRP